MTVRPRATEYSAALGRTVISHARGSPWPWPCCWFGFLALGRLDAVLLFYEFASSEFLAAGGCCMLPMNYVHSSPPAPTTLRDFVGTPPRAPPRMPATQVDNLDAQPIVVEAHPVLGRSRSIPTRPCSAPLRAEISRMAWLTSPCGWCRCYCCVRVNGAATGWQR